MCSAVVSEAHCTLAAEAVNRGRGALYFTDRRRVAKKKLVRVQSN